MNLTKSLLAFVVIVWVSAACQRALPGVTLHQYAPQKSAVSASSMVVTPHALATRAGLEVLEQGGNAVDASIAVHFAMAVVFPRAGNLGGGGFMVIRLKNGETDALDYREKAPATAHRDMYLDSLGNVIKGLSTDGHLAAGTPGTVAGLIAAHQKYGKLDFKKLLAPAIRLAEAGFPVSGAEADRLNSFQSAFRKFNTPPNPFLRENWKAGDILVQKELARTLRLIQDKGKSGFYSGETAREIVAEMQSGGGMVTLDDLKKYEAKWRKPLTGRYKEYKIISMPPSSSGGVALLQLLEMVEPYPLSQWGFQSKEAVHLMAEASRRVYADRSQYLGDSDFFPVPMDSLLNERYLLKRMADFNPAKATSSEAVGAGNFKVALESFETEHTSVVDAEGNAVSVTTTLNSNYGCKVWVDGAGFFLNNEMDDFSVKPGVPNQFGLVGAEANAIQPYKRMLSSMTPTIVEKNGNLFMVLGTPGGSTIITTVFQVFINVAEFGMDLEKAVNSGRFHHQWLPDLIMTERGAFNPATRSVLESMGHRFQEVDRIAVIKAILKLPDGRLNGVGDFRNPDDDARGN
ncbi:MAG: gamma-glutamyltransferase [Saprospiraceae bacterium]|nr:gamma-glutamyltransferase [Saprospiraceae bacterium]